MRTPGEPLFIVMVRFAPNPMLEVHGSERGTSTSPPGAQAGVGIPRRPAIFAARNVLTSAETITAELFPAAISAVFENGSAGVVLKSPPQLDELSSGS